MEHHGLARAGRVEILTKRRWPKLEKGQQIRLRNMKTGEFIYKPKGGSSGWRWRGDGKFTVWDSFNGPGHILGQFARAGTPGYDRRYNGINLDPTDVMIEIVELSVVKTLSAVEQMEERRQVLAEEEENQNYRDFRMISNDQVLAELSKKITSVVFDDLAKRHGQGLRFRSPGHIHVQDVKAFSKILLQKMMAGEL